MVGRLTSLANSARRVFDRSSARLGAVVVVATLSAVAIGVAAGQLSFLKGKDPKLPVSLVRVEVTFSAQRFAALLAAEQARRQAVVWSLATWDLVFPICYGAALASLFLWTERWQRFGARGAAVSSPPASRQRDLIAVAPLAAGLLDIFAENVPLFLAGRAILSDAASPARLWVRSCVLLGSAGASLKWALLLIFLLGTLRELVAGPRGAVLWRVRFSAAAVLLGGIPLLATPQGRDVLQRLVEGSHPVLRVVGAVASLAFAALAVWYCGRKLVQFRFADDPAPDPQGWSTFFGEHVPRMLGVALLVLGAAAFAAEGLATPTFLGVAAGGYLAALLVYRFRPGVLRAIGNAVTLSRWRALGEFTGRIGQAVLAVAVAALLCLPNPRWDVWSLRAGAALCLSAAWLFYLYVYFRRQRSAVAIGPVASRPPGPIGNPVKLGVAAAVLLSGTVLALFTGAPVQVAPAAGPVGVLALASANAVFIGSLTVWFGRRYRVPVVSLALAAALLFSLWNDSHTIRPAARPAGLPADRDRVAADFGRWMTSLRAETRPPADCRVPVVLVAAAGGGLRAAYWTGAALARIQDQTQGALGTHLYAISGVSGGSLGGALFAALLRDAKDSGFRPPEGGRTPEGNPRYHQSVRAFMAHDFLSPVLAKLIAPDFLQWFLPFPVKAFDRSTALEQSWEAAYAATTGCDTFAAGFLGLAPGRTPATDAVRPLVPALFLNATSVETGRRSIASTVTRGAGRGAAAFRDSYDMLTVLDTDIALSTAVHNSARFPYVSPAGHAADRPDGQERGHVVDGGYFENSGLETLREVHEVVSSYSESVRVRPIVLYLCNDPRACAADLRESPSEVVDSAAADELLSPVRTALNTRTARGSLARAAMQSLVGDDFLQLNVCGGEPASSEGDASGKAAAEQTQRQAERVVSPPLGWLLSTLAQDWMDWSLQGDTSRGVERACARHNAAMIEKLQAALDGGR